MSEKFSLTQKFYHYKEKQRSPQTKEEQRKLNAMLKKKERQGGIVFGYHGTSATRAREIQQNGFQDARCVEGGFGVYFWDDDYPNNALAPARKKAEEDGDNQYAVIEARCTNARPDFLMGRPQWLVNSGNIEILDIQFYEK
jgi:hypothetical protein